MDISREFFSAMQDAGLQPDCNPVADGALHRFHDKNDKHGTRNGWYVLYDGDFPAGAFGNWRNGITGKWSAKSDSVMSDYERDLYRKRMREAIRKREEALAQERSACRTKSSAIWEEAAPAPETHPYLVNKGIKPHNLRMKDTRLIVPVHDYAGVIQGIQYIDEAGTKRFLSGTAVTGNFSLIGEIESAPVIICEGFATGASIYEATGYPVLCALNCGNIKPVALALRERKPDSIIIIATDNDQWTEGNPGLTKATKAADLVRATVAVPTFKSVESQPVDFNDLHKLEGLEEVRRQITAAVLPEPPPSTDSPKPAKNKASGKPSAAGTILQLAGQYTYFHDEHGNPFAYVQGECIPVKDSRMKDTLSYLYYAETGKAPSNEALAQAINTLAAKSKFEGQQVCLHNRVAWHGDAILYDLGTNASIEISVGGWKKVESPILFRRYGHQQRQVEPIPGGDPAHLFSFLNVGDEHQLIILVAVICCYIPDIPRPILHPHGPQGAGKSSLFRIVKRLVDPSSLEISISPKDENELIRTITRHHIALFDNLSELSPRSSDIICAACTGSGIAKRALYTDDEDVIYTLKRCVGINGINMLTIRPDLLDRTLLLHLDRIPSCDRLPETELWQLFDQKRPAILGGIFDVLSKALAIFPTIHLEHLPRLADFAKWGYAVAEALEPGEGSRFLKAYAANVARQNQEVVAENSLCRAILTFLDKKERYAGTVGDLFARLREIASPDPRDATFPKAPKSLRQHIERIRATLNEYNVHVTYGKHTNEGMSITLENRNVASHASLPSQTQENDYSSSPEEEEIADRPIINDKGRN